MLLLICCVMLTGCNLIGEDEPDLDNLPPDTEANFHISNGTLKKYTGRGGDVTIPSGVVAIDMEVFENNRSLTSVVIPEGVKIIGAYAFLGCPKLTSVKLPSTLQYIDELAFSNCTALTSITIPASVKEIKYEAFSGNTALKTVSVGWGFPLCSATYSYDNEYIELSAMVGRIINENERGEKYQYNVPFIDIFAQIDLSHVTLKVPKGLKARYENTQMWGTFGTIEEDPNIATPADGLATKPEARSVYDNQSGGIYKGFFTDVSGSFLIDLQGDEPRAILFYDGGISEWMTAYESNSFVSGEATALTFSGLYAYEGGGGIGLNIYFTVEADGSNPQVTSSFMMEGPILVEKELSTTLVEVYEGTYSGSTTEIDATNGLFNIIVKGNNISGLCDLKKRFHPYILSGTINDGVITASGADQDEEEPPLIVTGSIANGSVSGSYNQNPGEDNSGSGTWSGRRMF